MPQPGEPFTIEDLADLIDVGGHVPVIWHANGVGPESFEQRTPEGVKRLFTAEAIRAFVEKHRVMRTDETEAKPSKRRTASRLETGLLTGGGVFEIAPAK